MEKNRKKKKEQHARIAWCYRLIDQSGGRAKNGTTYENMPGVDGGCGFEFRVAACFAGLLVFLVAVAAAARAFTFGGILVIAFAWFFCSLGFTGHC
jgi:hypothetical protein